MLKNDKNTINAWCSYDAANSGYTLVVSTILYPVFYESVSKDHFGSELVTFLGFSIKNTVLYEYAISFGYLVSILLTLLLAGIADTNGYRKRFMMFFTIIGAAACAGMFNFAGGNIEYGISMPILAIIGFSCSLVYYNSFIPLIATPDLHDKISAKGFSFGYGGSMLLLLFVLFFIKNPGLFGLSSSGEAVRYSFVLVGIWWSAISLIAFKYLKDNPTKLQFKKSVFLHGFKELKSVYNDIKSNSKLHQYLASFFFFSIGVQTIMIVASLFAAVELGLKEDKLIPIIMLVQVTGIVGATIVSKVSNIFGDKRVLVSTIIIWIAICLSGIIIQTAFHFMIVAFFTGIVMGAIQSQARAIWAKFIPEGSNKTASYFSFYDNTEKLAIVIGMFSFAIIDKISGSLRVGMVSLSAFFIISLFLYRFDFKMCLKVFKSR